MFTLDAVKMGFRQVGYQKKLESSIGRCPRPKNHQATAIGPIWWMTSWRLVVAAAAAVVVVVVVVYIIGGGGGGGRSSSSSMYS